MRTSDGIFITGVPRSGTTLLAAVLASHPRISCGPETHVFSNLNDEIVRRITQRDGWPGEALQYLLSLENFGNNVIHNYGLRLSEIQDYLSTRPREIGSLLTALTELYARRQGKPLWAEKTPNHLASVTTLRQAFPRARIIRIVRDSRDVALSVNRLPWGPDTQFESALQWKWYDQQSRHFFETDKQCTTIRYEDLVKQPRATIGELCDFLGETFHPAMLEPQRAEKHVNRTGEPWKKKVASPIFDHHVGRWKQTIDPLENRRVEALLGDRLLAFGYPLVNHFSRSAAVFPPVLEDPRLWSNLPADVRLWQKHQLESNKISIFLGDPAEWLRRRGVRRLSKALRLSVRVLGARMISSKVCWYRDTTQPTRDFCSKIVRRVLERSAA
mgnify:CR=1 FL=1